jgi:hypothetical protein
LGGAKSARLVSNIVLPVLMGEMVTMLWLVIRGARPRALSTAHAAC